MARPKKADPARFTHRLPHVRCTASDHALVLSKAKEAGVSCCEYVRRAAIEGQVIVPQSRVDFALTHQVNMIGVNLRQALEAFRRGGWTDPDELLSAIEKVNRIADVLMDDMLEG